MAYEELQNRNMSDSLEVFRYVGDVVPIFYPLVLLVIFLIASFITFQADRLFKGQGNLMTSFAIASLFTTIVSIVLQTLDLVSAFPVVICVILTSVFTLIMFLSD